MQTTKLNLYIVDFGWQGAELVLASNREEAKNYFTGIKKVWDRTDFTLEEWIELYMQRVSIDCPGYLMCTQGDF